MRLPQAIVCQLSDRLEDPDADETMEANQGRPKKTRKDLFGIGGTIDIFATRALIASPVAPILKKHCQMLKECGVGVDLKELKADPIQHQRIQSIIAGSLRLYDRLQEAGLVVSKACPHCGAQKGTLRHIVWECEKWAHVRKPVFDAINAYVNEVAPNIPQRQQKIAELCQTPCVSNCGVFPKTRYFKEGGAALPTHCQQFSLQNEPRHRLSERQRSKLEYGEEGRILAFTDGTACHPDGRRRRRVAWGTCYADERPWNRRGLVLGGMQTAYRAELTAISQVVHSALHPTHIVSDCESVVNCAAAIFHGNHEGIHKGDHDEVWKCIQEVVRAKPPGYFKVTWAPSHTDLTKGKK